MIGLGGSQLYIPVLFWLGMNFKTEAIPLGMMLNVVTSTSSSITYIRKRMINWKLAIPVAIAMAIFAPFGAILSSYLSTKIIILLFSITTFISFAFMISDFQPNICEIKTKRCLVYGLIGGAILGFIAGLLGRGGGAYVVPLLILIGLKSRSAAATSCIIVTAGGFSSFISHIFGAAKPDVTLWALCAISVIIGSQLGSRFMAKKVSGKFIRILFAVVLTAVAIILLIQSFI